ncbi:hypothetical protein H4R35_001751 [Dimargaris xerosporica]|nr:hypothetical protein H4R35_001751 [Dimargaris xerosporica]
MSAITIQPDFAWCALVAVAMGLQCTAQGFSVGAARKKYKVPHPDNGSGRFAAKLDDQDWEAFNNVNRAHLNYVENLATAQSSVLLAGLFCPRTSAILGLTYIIGRSLYATLYAKRGPQGRVTGFIVSTLAYVGLIGVTVFGSLKAIGLW